MKNVPNRLECAYCTRNRNKGGECSTRTYSTKEYSDLQGCLAFKADKRGCIRTKDFRVLIPMYQEFPFVDSWTTDFLVDDNSNPVKINKIYGITWDSRGGNIAVHCNCDFFVNEYANDYKDENKEPMLRLVKG